MYHRVLVYPVDQKFLCFLWWDIGDITQPHSTYCMTVQVFGAGPSGFNANVALRCCADDGIGRYEASEIEAVHRNFYVDDFIMSVPDEAIAIQFVSSLSSLLKEGGFRLHKWLSTSLAVVETVQESERASSLKEITSDSELPQERALGITGMLDEMVSYLMSIYSNDKRLVPLRSERFFQRLRPFLIRWDSCHLSF